MSLLPLQLYWVIANPAERHIDALYWRKVRALALDFSTTVTVLNSSDTQPLFDSLRFSKQERIELQTQQEHELQQQLNELKTLLVNKYHIQTDYQLLKARPFFQAAIDLIKQQENAWMIVQSSKNTGIANIIWQFLRHSPAPLYIAKEKNWNVPLNILAAIDPTHENDKQFILDHKILSTATAIAECCHSNLHIIHCYSPVIMADHVIQKQIEKIYRENSHTLIDTYDIDNNQVHLIAGKPAEEIQQLCQKLDIDLLIMGAVSRNSLERIFIGNTAEEVLPAIESDILLLKA